MTTQIKPQDYIIRHATENDAALLLSFIQELADYEKLSHEVVATEKTLKQTLFGKNQVAEAILGFYKNEPVSFAIFFHNYSTFLAKPGLYLEDLFVKPASRGNGFGKRMLAYVAKIATERNCGRLEWSVLNWNEPALKFYQSVGAQPLTEWTTQRLIGKDLEKLAEKF